MEKVEFKSGNLTIKLSDYDVAGGFHAAKTAIEVYDSDKFMASYVVMEKCEHAPQGAWIEEFNNFDKLSLVPRSQKVKELVKELSDAVGGVDMAIINDS